MKSQNVRNGQHSITSSHGALKKVVVSKLLISIRKTNRKLHLYEDPQIHTFEKLINYLIKVFFNHIVGLLFHQSSPLIDKLMLCHLRHFFLFLCSSIPCDIEVYDLKVELDVSNACVRHYFYQTCAFIGDRPSVCGIQ